MNWSLFLSQYIWWHYHAGLRALMRHAGNLPRLVWRLFSPLSLLRTLFAPFQRLQEPYPEQASLKAWASSFVVNSLMRLLGAVVRIILLLFGLVFFLLASVLAGIAILAWVIWPLILIGLFVLIISTVF